MTTPVPGRVEVDAPPIEPYTYGLLSVAQVETGDGRWQNSGVEYSTDACAQGGRVEGSCPVPLPPDEVTAQVTESNGEGVGVRATPPSATATTGLLFVADPNLPGPADLEIVPPEGDPVPVRIAPGETLPFDTGVEGSWQINWPVAACGGESTAFTVPYPAGTEELGSCLGYAYPVVWSSDAASQATVSYTVRPYDGGDVVDSGTLAPGQSTQDAPTYYWDNAYHATFTVGGSAEPQTVEVSVPVAGTIPYQLSFAVAAGTTHDKPLAEGLDWVEGGGPFTVYHRAECNPVGFDQAEQRALARLRLIEQREVEKAFSLQLGAAGARTPLGTTAVPLAVAVGALEQDAALHYAGQPTLHAPRWTQPSWTTARLVSQQGPVLRTELESRVAFGGGFYDDPQAPADPNPTGGQFWLFATGTVRAHRSQPFAREVVDPPTNTRTAIAERTYALDHDCYVAAVLVTVAPGGAA